MRNIVGPRIRALRRRPGRKITQAELAARLQAQGVQLGETAISHIEAGRRPVTDLQVVAFAKALGVQVGDLFADADWGSGSGSTAP